MRAMILMRFAISIFALTLLGLAVSLGSAQTQPDDLAQTRTLTER
jgi:hypothetical protein